jgi:hypothetical protein
MTAMQELIKFSTYSSGQYPIAEIIAKAHQLLEKEKQQIVKANNDGWAQGIMQVMNKDVSNIKDGEDYYNQNFKKQ